MKSGEKAKNLTRSGDWISN